MTPQTSSVCGPGVAFVDICGTLVDSNTLTEFVKFVHSSGRSKRKSKRYFLFCLMLYRMGLLNGKRLRSAAVKSLFGLHKNLITSLASDFFESVCHPRLNNELLSHLEYLKKQNFRIVLVSASLEVIAEAISERLGFGDVVATKLGYQNQIATGSIFGEFCEKEEKVRRIINMDDFDNIENNRLAGYGNSLDDLDLLEFCDFPHAIWATADLRKVAIDRQWPTGVHPIIDSYDPKIVIGS